MMNTPPLRLTCRCGHLALDVAGVSPKSAARLACGCQGCRTYAERMNPAVLDEDRATHRFVVNPATMTIARGAGSLACLQQTKGGALRWYARCCQSDLALTLPSSSIPFVGLAVARIEDAASVDTRLGPILARVNLDLPRPDRAAKRADLRSLFRLLAHLGPLTWRWWRKRREASSPLLEEGRPIVEVERLAPPERSLAQAVGCR